MDSRSIYMLLILAFSLCLPLTKAFAQTGNTPLGAGKLLSGKWVRMTLSGPVGLEFKADGAVEVDFGNDGNTDVVSGYEFNNDTIRFSDREGEMCSEAGIYRTEGNDCYLSFDLVDDLCNGRVKMTMGFWTRPDFEDRLNELSAKLAQTGNPEMNLTRARIYLATGDAANARTDLDTYIRHDAGNARAYINRAGTRFPSDMEGVVSDCDKAIQLEPGNKNAWFLRGLANYEMGNKEKACADFSRAIDLGFSILRIAEEQRCSVFWKDEE